MQYNDTSIFFYFRGKCTFLVYLSHDLSCVVCEDNTIVTNNCNCNRNWIHVDYLISGNDILTSEYLNEIQYFIRQ